MNLQHVRDFLNGVQNETKEKTIKTLESNQYMIGQIITCLMTDDGSQSELADVVYSNLFSLYQHGDDTKKAFVLHFLPAFMWEYLFISFNHGQKGHGKLEAILLAIYNAEVVDHNNKTKYQKFRLPSLTRPSLYHEPSLAKTSASALTEFALSRHEQIEVAYRQDGPGRKLSRIPACYRFSVVSFVLEQYNHYIAFIGELSLEAACKMALLVTSCGFEDLCLKEDVKKDLEKFSECSRIPVDNSTLVQLIYVVHYAYYNGYSSQARPVLKALNFRAEYGLFSQAYLLTQSIDNNLKCEGDNISPLGLQVPSSISDRESVPQKRRCPYEILLCDRSVLSVLEIDPTQYTLQPKSSKEGRPRKSKSWSNTSSGKLSSSPTASNVQSPDRLSTPGTPRMPTAEKIELVTGL